MRLKVNPDSSFAGQTLRSLELRKRHGVNVVAVRRGSRTLVAPPPDLQIFPKDELLVLVTDEQVDRVRPLLENSSAPSATEPSLDGYELLVVGIERGSERIINPDTDLRIHVGDRLLIVGEAETLKTLT